MCKAHRRCKFFSFSLSILLCGIWSDLKIDEECPTRSAVHTPVLGHYGGDLTAANPITMVTGVRPRDHNGGEGPLLSGGGGHNNGHTWDAVEGGVHQSVPWHGSLPSHGRVLYSVMSKYHKMDPNKYSNICKSHIIYRMHIRIYSDATSKYATSKYICLREVAQIQIQIIF